MAIMTGGPVMPGSFDGYYTAGVPVAGTNAIETLTVTATGGTYVLSYEGNRTTPLAYNANAAAIQTALLALNTIGASGVAVSGTGPFVITFGASLGLRPVSLIVADNTAATGGTASVAMTTPGVSVSGRGAAVGARMVDTVNAKLYINGGTSLAPVWKIVTSA